MARILIAEDEPVLRANMCEFLGRSGHDVVGVEDGAAALELALEQEFAVVVTDIRMPRMDGVALLRRLVAERPETLVLLVTAFASVDTAIEALRLGAFDYLLKPIELEELRRKIEHLLEYRALKDEVGRLRRTVQQQGGFEGLVGESPAMRAIFELVERVAPTPSTVLITGESGTGKELVARAVHARSRLQSAEFLAINVAALPAEVIESQLFGHERGAYTSADRRRDGLLRAVHGGTVFLDEVGDLPEPAQAKLLRAIENHEVLPVGAEHPVPVEFRLIAATNHDLESDLRSGRLRQDLYFRLNVFRIDLPPLRARREDIPALVAHFVALHAQRLGRHPPKVSNEAMKLLFQHDYPGNVRELSNVIERAMILLSGDGLGPEHLPEELRRTGAAPVELKAAVADFERNHIAWVLRSCGGVRDKAAERLGIDPATLYRKLARYGIDE